jgi:hypothetical protein
MPRGGRSIAQETMVHAVLEWAHTALAPLASRLAGMAVASVEATRLPDMLDRAGAAAVGLVAVACYLLSFRG